MTRTYRLIKQGRSYYIAIPKILIREDMIKYGVTYEVIEVTENEIVLILRTAKNGEHNTLNQENRENTQKPRTTIGVQ